VLNESKGEKVIMKKPTLILSFLLFISSAQAFELSTNNVPSEIFNFEMTNNFKTIVFTEISTGRKSEAQLQFTSAFEKKVAILPENAGDKAVEMLLVLTASGHRKSTLEIFVPGQTDVLISSSQTQSFCTVDMSGNFSLNDEVLKQHISVEKNSKGNLELNINGILKAVKCVKSSDQSDTCVCPGVFEI
jgi:hypothetical protein